jgi:pyruvate,water dikinase
LPVYRFPGSTNVNLAEVGGKAFSLLKGSEYGLPVPPGIVLPVDFFSSWMTEIKSTGEWSTFMRATSDADLNKSCNQLKAAASRRELSSEQKKAVEDGIRQIGSDCLFAVRSSSPEEDLEGTSFAGVYETILGATAANIEDAIKRAFASCFDFRIVSYKREHHFNVSDPKIAVVIQEQIASEIAGVGFSLNPLTNNYDEAVINSNWGLGESVVSGTVTPDSFTVDKNTMRLTHKSIGAKERSVWLTPAGGTEEKLKWRSEDSSLSEEQMRAVTDLVIHVEDLYTRPMDIEWAFAAGRLYLLQARPITAYVPLPPDMVTTPGQKKRLYLDATISVQGIYKPLSPMGTAVLKQFMRQMSGQIFGISDPFANIDTAIPWVAWGRMYLVISNVMALIGKERIAEALTNLDPLAAKTIQQLDESVYVSSKKKLHPPPHLVVQLPRFFARLTAAFVAPERRQRRARIAIDEFMRDARDMANTDIPAWDLADRLLTLTMRLVLTKTMPPFLMSRLAREEMKSVVGKDIEPDLVKLERALPNNVTTEMGLALFSMSQIPQGSAAFEKAWESFVRLYGHRGPGELDIASPRYRDSPQLLLNQIDMLRNSATEKDNPQKRFDDAKAERQQAFKEICGKVSKERGWMSVKTFQLLYRVYEPLSGYREMHKYCLIFALDRLRERMLKDADALVSNDRLDSREQIFDLTMDDLKSAAADSQYDLRDAARRNRVPHDRLARVPQLPVLIDSRGLILRPAPEPARERESIGTAISPGIARGRIKVLHAPDEKPLLRGEIMVARATDPGWTPLFVNAAAVILEVGGMLQHGALVAREYGLPCVSGIAGATEIWTDGTLVEVDGSSGVVRVLKDG